MASAARFTPHIQLRTIFVSYCFPTNTWTNLGIRGPLAKPPRVWSSYFNLFCREKETTKKKGESIDWVFSWDENCSHTSHVKQKAQGRNIIMNERGTKKEGKLESYISTYLLMDKISQYGWHHHVGFSNFFSSFLFIFSFVFRRQ